METVRGVEWLGLVVCSSCLTMNEAKMRPYGGEAAPPEKVGVQLKTKIYIDPSKKETTAPHSQMRGLSSLEERVRASEERAGLPSAR